MYATTVPVVMPCCCVYTDVRVIIIAERAEDCTVSYRGVDKMML